jgi:hypothetical protein
MKAQRYFILTEAAAMLPLVRRILIDIREARARIAHLRKLRGRAELTNAERATINRQWRHWGRKLANCQDEAITLGVEITSGIRCEALFPFEHQWIGPAGDGKIRTAYFVYSDAQTTIEEWYFDGWPSDRRPIWPSWWETYRPGQVPADRSRAA